MLRHIKNCFYAVSFFFFAIMTAVYLFGTENTLAYLETLPDDEDISCLNIRKWPNCSINFKDWCKVQKPPREDEMLPDDIVQNVKQFVLFIGHARSGSSIIGKRRLFRSDICTFLSVSPSSSVNYSEK